MGLFGRYRRERLLSFAVVALIAMQTASAQQHQYYAGDGGKGIRLAVLEPVGKGLSADEQWMLSLVQGSITGDFNKYSAMTIIDRQNLEKIFAEWKESMSGHYSDADRVKIGNLTNASHILTGTISKTANAFMLELTVTDVASGVRKASYSPTPVSPLALENLSAIKTASADVLRQLGVVLTEAALAELKQSANTARIQAETMLARGIAAQRQGTEVAALSYFYQAASFDPSLVEAASRSSVMVANISSGNIGADARNDIVWRKNWVARLKETEETFYKIINAADPPYTLYYSTAIRRGDINYREETLDLSIEVIRRANNAWFNALNRSLMAADAVLDGLNATKRKDVWELDGWPRRGVSETNPFREGWGHSAKSYDITVVFELINEKGQAIGHQTYSTNPSFSISIDRDKMSVAFTENEQETVRFRNVKVDDISDNLTIRVASVNGAPPQNARFTISAISADRRRPLVDGRDGNSYKTVRIGGKTWMAENLRYQPQPDNTLCYENNKSNCEQYGRLYKWNEAMRVCPEGWHLPTNQEWSDLVNDEINGFSVGKSLRSSDHGGADIFGFSARLGGYYNISHTSFYSLGDEGHWWTATEVQEEDNNRGYRRRAQEAYSRKITRHNDEVYDGGSDINNWLSVRCVYGPPPRPSEPETEMETGYTPPASASEETALFQAAPPARSGQAVAASETAYESPGRSRPQTDAAATRLRVNDRVPTQSESFDPSALYFFVNTSTIDSRDYGDKNYQRTMVFGGVGWDFLRTLETRNTVGGGFIAGGGSYGKGIWGFIFGMEAKNLFWLMKRHIAVPMSIGIDWRPVMANIESRDAANFIDVMSPSDALSDEKLTMRMHFFDLTPAVGVQIFFSRSVSAYAGYAYNLSIPVGWSAYYKIPGKTYEDNSWGDGFKVPEEYALMQDVKERFQGVPGTLRVGLKIHTKNFKR